MKRLCRPSLLNLINALFVATRPAAAFHTSHPIFVTASACNANGPLSTSTLCSQRRSLNTSLYFAANQKKEPFFSRFFSSTVQDTTTSSDLFEDVDSMLEASSLVYFLASLSKARKDERGLSLKDAGFLDILPKTSKEVVEWAKANSHLLEGSDDDIKYLTEMMAKDREDESGMGTLEVFDDEYAFAGRNSEIVYGITKNPDQKRITIVFRGSSTKRDWLQNFQFRSEEVDLDASILEDTIPNINLSLLSDFEEVRLQRGFVAYLFERYTKDLDGDRTEPPKFTKMIGHVKRLLKDNPGYELYVTGHSLGGALATLAATGASLSDDIDKPVKLISFAAPHVGKSKFADAAQKLESSKKLLHIRVTNSEDIVPQGFGLFGYKHFGLHLNLRKDKHILSFDQEGMSMTWPWKLLNAHLLATSNNRLLKAKDDIKQYDIDTVFDTIREQKGE